MAETDRDTPVTALLRELDACEPIMGEYAPGTGRVVQAWEVPEWLMLRLRERLASSDDVAGSGERLDVERLADALDAPGVFDAPLDDALGLAADIAREYDALAAPTTEAPPKDAPE